MRGMAVLLGLASMTACAGGELRSPVPRPRPAAFAFAASLRVQCLARAELGALTNLCVRGPPRLSFLCMGPMSKAQLALVDAALARLHERLAFASHAHQEMPADKRVKIDWLAMPEGLDPHSVTWRGSSIPVGSSINTTSHATIKETVNTRSLRKRAQVENFASMLFMQNLVAGSVVVDFGSGSGNLLLPLAHLFPLLHFVGVDLKPRAIALLQQRAAAAKLANVGAHCGAIEDYRTPFDVAISLHACGPASNAVLAAALHQGASFLVSPCCVGKLTPQATVDRSKRSISSSPSFFPSGTVVAPTVVGAAGGRVGGGEAGAGGMDQDRMLHTRSATESRHFRSRRLEADYDVGERTYELFAQLADRGDWVSRTSREAEGSALVRAKLCKTAVELDRLWWVRQADPSYNVSLFRMWGMDDPPFSKTDMLVGWPGLGALRVGTEAPRNTADKSQEGVFLTH